jgi:hypothetical protein
MTLLYVRCKLVSVRNSFVQQDGCHLGRREGQVRKGAQQWVKITYE